jgi:hypothetical protein
MLSSVCVSWLYREQLTHRSREVVPTARTGRGGGIQAVRSSLLRRYDTQSMRVGQPCTFREKTPSALPQLAAHPAGRGLRPSRPMRSHEPIPYLLPHARAWVPFQ